MFQTQQVGSGYRFKYWRQLPNRREMLGAEVTANQKVAKYICAKKAVERARQRNAL